MPVAPAATADSRAGGIAFDRVWVFRGGLALADQAIVSGSNFAVSVLLARWLDLRSYGAFSLAFTIFLLVSGLHNALLLEPMSVLGPSKYAHRLALYLRSQIQISFWLTLPIGGALVIAAAVTLGHRGPMSGALLGAGVSAPLILLYWAARRFCYILHKPGVAALGGAVYMATTLAALFILRAAGFLSASCGFLSMGLGGALAALCLIGWCRLRTADEAAESSGCAAVLQDHWAYGRWILAAAVVLSLSTYLPTFYASGVLGIEAAGILRAMSTLNAPLAQAITALATLALPGLAREFGRDPAAMGKKGMHCALVLSALAGGYELVLLAMSGPLEKLLFGGKFASHAWLMPVFGLVPVFTAMGTGFSLILRAAQKPHHYLYAGLVTAPVGCCATLWLTRGWGLAGAAWSTVLTTATSAAVTYLLFRIWLAPRMGEREKSRQAPSRSTPLRILFVGHTYVVGVNQAKLAAVAATGDAEVGLIAPDTWVAAEWGRVLRCESPFPVVSIYSLPVWFGGRVGAYLFSPWSLWRAIRDFRPDIIEVEQEAFALSAMEMAVAAELSRVPLVLFCQENAIEHPRLWLRRWTRRFVLHQSALVLCGNRGARKLLKTWGYTGPTETMTQLGVETRLFSPAPAAKTGDFTIGFTGRFVGQKGIDLLLAAARLLKDKGLEFRVILCGAGPAEESLRQEAGSRQVDDLIEWVPAVPHAEVPAVMRRFDVLVLPSRTTATVQEQFGHVLIEAMAMGIPAVGSDSGAIPEVIGNRDLIFREGDANGLAEILERLLKRADWRAEIGEFSRRRAHALFSHERLAERLVDILVSVHRQGS